jgi:hypothetical protein
VPEVINADALAFAKLRAAYLEPPRQVADDLLAAAAQPTVRLKGVTPFAARMRAAEVLTEAGDRLAALEVLDGSPDTAGAGLIQRASERLGTGDVAGAQALVTQIRTWPVGDEYGIWQIMEFVRAAAKAGYFDQALAWADAAWAAAMDNRVGSDWVMARGPKMLQMLEEELREQQRRNLADDAGTHAEEHQVQPASGASPESAVVADSPPWPALADGRLLWWPEGEYERLVAQVPDLRILLGATWQQHKAKVEATLRAFSCLQPDARVALSLVRAEFMAYGLFLELAGSDPRLPEPLTAFTSFAADHQKPRRWPPRRLDRCWCGSDLRYARCCGR